MLLFYEVDRNEQSLMQAGIGGTGDIRLPHMESLPIFMWFKEGTGDIRLPHVEIYLTQGN